MNRHDWILGRWQLIKRSYELPQYGAILWRTGQRRTLDIWFHCTLWTITRWERS